MKRLQGLFIIALLLFLVVVFPSMVMADGESVEVRDGILVINVHAAHHASVVYYPGLKVGGYSEASFEIKMRGDNTGRTMAPGLFLWWPSSNSYSWIALRLHGTHYVITGIGTDKGFDEPKATFKYRDPFLVNVNSWNSAPQTPEDWYIPTEVVGMDSKDDWSRLKIVLTPSEMSFYVAYLDEEWEYLTTLERAITNEEPYLIIGKANPWGAGRPYLANNMPRDAASGTFGAVYVDDFVVKVDGQVILTDPFVGEELGKHWVPLLQDDPDLDANISILDRLRENFLLIFL